MSFLHEAWQDPEELEAVEDVLMKGYDAASPFPSESKMLVSVEELPPQCRAVFDRYISFNRVQSYGFEDFFYKDCNVVVSAPTGSGKTALFELAICRLFLSTQQYTYKALYMAPTKALCSERQADWGVRFARLGLTCGELTGDTAIEHQDAVKRSDIIITTPEKWDSVSRRWQDSSSLVRMVRLFLVDEVHMLRDERGAILEVVVSRMKQATDSCRIAALSATVPNIEDVAAWLGFSSLKPSVPARILKFDDSFRPVALRKEVIGYRVNNMNSFQFSSHLTRYVTDLIAKFSSGRPTIVFCSTRKDALTTANRLIEDFEASKATLWPLPAVDFTVTDKALAKLLLKGVAIHHAGLSHRDRVIVENGFLGGHLQIICCTSTLAVGINLPAHLVILKGTRQYIGGSMVEYSDLDILQMVGRAGRPQFDDFGVAVIMTDAQHVDRYRALVTGEDLLESQLHLQLIEHLNAEIVQGTIKSVPQAMRWLKGTFLYVRMQKNPEHYTIADKVLGSDEALGEICRSALDSLETTGLITVAGEQVSPTSHGRTMANGYVRFNTMRQLLSLPRQASLETIYFTTCKADEFADLRLTAGERAALNELRRHRDIRFATKEKVESTWQKVILLSQADIGGIDVGELKDKVRDTLGSLLAQSHYKIANTLARILSSTIDVAADKQDTITLLHALELRTAVLARCWQNTPGTLRQVRGIGKVSLQALKLARIVSIKQLAVLDSFELERIFRRNPPFGVRMLEDLASFPQFTVQLEARSHKRLAEFIMVGIHLSLTPLPTSAKEMRNNGRAVFITFSEENQLVDFAQVPLMRVTKGYQRDYTIGLKHFTERLKVRVVFDQYVGFDVEDKCDLGLSPSQFPEIDRYRDIGVDSATTDDPAGFDEVAGDDAEWSARFDELERRSSSSAGVISCQKSEAPVDLTETSKILPPNRTECAHRCRDKQKCLHPCCNNGVELSGMINKKRKMVDEVHAVDQINRRSEQQLRHQATLQGFLAARASRRAASTQHVVRAPDTAELLRDIALASHESTSTSATELASADATLLEACDVAVANASSSTSDDAPPSKNHLWQLTTVNRATDNFVGSSMVEGHGTVMKSGDSKPEKLGHLDDLIASIGLRSPRLIAQLSARSSIAPSSNFGIGDSLRERSAPVGSSKGLLEGLEGCYFIRDDI